MPEPTIPPENLTQYALENISRRIDSLEEEVKGLHDAHRTTVEAMRANTTAMEGLNRTIERIESTVEKKVMSLSDNYSQHILDTAKDQASLNYLALKAWGTTLVAIGSTLLLLWAYRAPLMAMLSGGGGK
jgi:cell division septum initiation protein DivIVA